MASNYVPQIVRTRAELEEIVKQKSDTHLGNYIKNLQEQRDRMQVELDLLQYNINYLRRERIRLLYPNEANNSTNQ